MGVSATAPAVSEAKIKSVGGVSGTVNANKVVTVPCDCGGAEPVDAHAPMNSTNRASKTWSMGVIRSSHLVRAPIVSIPLAESLPVKVRIKHLITVTGDCNLSESRGSIQLLGPHGLKRRQQGRTRRSAPTGLLRGDRLPLRRRALFFGLALGPDLGLNADVFRGDRRSRHPAARRNRKQDRQREGSWKSGTSGIVRHHKAFLARRASQAFTCRVTCFRAVPPV